MMEDGSPADVEKGPVRQDTSYSSAPSADTALNSPKSVSSSLAGLWWPSKLAREEFPEQTEQGRLLK